eukprot:CAMPEP_0170471274 /NCGR_PEP_ID=MMETSP0123-20130129/13529_1 /TAXON_ID=182087 /ORGANISM="Favella ehrenbergii, Strain Fehren 1" /LENGTH=38 /DNA_ID= /DNA_START= /DNA_END= /DNA_ORIENTATION=
MPSLADIWDMDLPDPESMAVSSVLKSHSEQSINCLEAD